MFRKPLLDEVMGVSCTHIDFDMFEAPVHKAMRVSLLDLKHEARREGFDLRIASGYRSFERQLFIWNGKTQGQREVLDDQGQPLDLSQLSPIERVRAIMRWSALPGASRHHWGSDIDVFDAAALKPDERLALTLDETCGNGPFAPMHRWLDEYLEKQDAFFRPYCSSSRSSSNSPVENNTIGVAEEPWHLSYRPLAASFAEQLTCECLYRQLRETEPLGLKDVVLDNLVALFDDFVFKDSF